MSHGQVAQALQLRDQGGVNCKIELARRFDHGVPAVFGI